MNEQSKAAKRRYSDGAFHSRYFVGNGIDIGSKEGAFNDSASAFRGILSVRGWDIDDGDAQYMNSINDNTFDFVHSSHCLEHMVDVKIALQHWIRITKPGGFLIITVPDEDMYERGIWPSQNNTDHKHSFTICKDRSWSPVSVNVTTMCHYFSPIVETERVQLIQDFFQSNKIGDQTLLPNVESAIEFIWRKR